MVVAARATQREPRLGAPGPEGRGGGGDLRRAIRSLYAVHVLAPSPAFVRRTLAWRIVAPVTVAVVAGSALAVTLSIPRSISGYSEIPYGFIAVCAAGALLTGVIAWHVTWRACVRSADTLTFAPPDE